MATILHHNSPRTWFQQLSWLQTATFLALITFLFYTNIVSCSKHDIPSYRDYCSSVVPESTPTHPETTTIPFSPNQDGYYLGGDEIFDNLDSHRHYHSSYDRRTLLFRTHTVHSTASADVFNVHASLILQPGRIMYGFPDSSLSLSSWTGNGALSFEIEGFWSKSTGKLCMIGSSSTYSKEGKLHTLFALVKIKNIKSSSNITSLVTGTLESLSSADDWTKFLPVSFLMFPLMNYSYTEVKKDADSGSDGGLDSARGSLSLPLSVSICSVFSNEFVSFQLEYPSVCNSSKNCSPFGDSSRYLPNIMSMSLFQCRDDQRSVRLLIEFAKSSYYSYSIPFNQNTTWVAEGKWKATKNQLHVVACRISTQNNTLDGSKVEDCSMRLSLMFPAVLSIGNTSRSVGYIWSNKGSNSSGYFDKIRFRGYGLGSVEIPGSKYEYSLFNTAKNSCPKKQSDKHRGKKYPGSDPNDIRFDISIRNPKGRRSRWGYANIVSIGDKIAPRNYWSSSRLDKQKDESELQPTNISYIISLTSYNSSSKDYEQVEISAEGVYDGKTGVLCMVGCKYVNSSSLTSKDDSMDCKILVSVQFPPLNSKYHIEGRIESNRNKTSLLHFESISFYSVPYYSHRQSIWRMDFEIIMALISNTLVCVSVGYQILYVKKRPGMFPFISLAMLAVLTLGLVIPLVLNFEALFMSKNKQQSVLLLGGGWLEVNEVIVRVVTMIAFLLQFRLLQLVFSAKISNENHKASWIAEKKTIYVCLPIYAVGGLITLLVNWKKYKQGNYMKDYYYNEEQSVWVDFRSYAGLVMDGFLLPQIMFNIFNNSKEKALSHLFYMGITFVRLLPHAYDLYRAHSFIDDLQWSYSYMYADRSTDYFSTAWDVIIPSAGVVFGGIMYLQQRNGGRCLLPKRFNQLQGYEKVPVASNL